MIYMDPRDTDNRPITVVRDRDDASYIVAHVGMTGCQHPVKAKALPPCESWRGMQAMLEVFAEAHGWISIDREIAVAGTLYRLQLDGNDDLDRSTIKHLAASHKIGTGGRPVGKSWQKYTDFPGITATAWLNVVMEWTRLFMNRDHGPASAASLTHAAIDAAEEERPGDAEPGEQISGETIDGEVLPPVAVAVPADVTAVAIAAKTHTPAAVSAQYRRAISGVLEMLRFGAMLIEVDTVLARENSRASRRSCKGDQPSLAAWLSANCPSINYKTAMRFKGLADEMVAFVKAPAKLPATLLLPGPDGAIHLDDLPGNVNAQRVGKLQRQIWEMVEGKSARQLMFDLRVDESASRPRTGGDVQLQAWLRERYPDLAGTKLAGLPEAIQAEFAEFCNGRAPSDADVLAAKRDAAKRYWERQRMVMTEMGGGDDPTWAMLEDQELLQTMVTLEHVAKAMKRTLNDRGSR